MQNLAIVTRSIAVCCLLLGLAACATGPKPPSVAPEVQRMYAEVQDGDILIPAVPPQYLTDDNIRREVDYPTNERPGTIVVDPYAKYLYFVQPDDKALRYRIAVGRAGRGFSGNASVAYSRDWPYWTPTPFMLRNEPELYGPHRAGMKGGLNNPLGARALYLYRNGKDTRYRIHGTSDPGSIGREDTAGCIRLFNQDIIHLEEIVPRGSRVKVLTAAQSSTPLGPSDPAPALPLTQ